MCVFSAPKPPPLPKPEPRDSPIENTAARVVVGDNRTQQTDSTTKSNTTKSSNTRRKKQRITSRRMGRRLGTRSLQIPLNPGVQSGNLNYPT